MDILNKIEQIKIVPVAVIEDSANAVPLGNALLEAKLPLVEITFRTAAAAKSIEILKNEFPDMIVGAGTVLKIDQVKNAVDAG
jgi:2-dehydro-3-deoxyphosphogluconate aldolase/(4S)-4-hydroxy-2-oxoglutarate aldolase